MHVAVEWEQLGNIRLLAKYGAALDKQNLAGQTPLHLATMRNSVEMCEVVTEL